MQVFKGASFLIYGYIGWEALTYVLEEVPHAEKRMPVVIPLCNVLLTIYFFLTSLSITLALDVSLFPNSVILPDIYGRISVAASRYVLSVGSVCGLSATLLTVLVPASRILRTFASDGLLCAKLDTLGQRTGSPWVALLINLLISVLMLFFRDELLIETLQVTLPLRLLVTVVVTILQRYSASPLGMPPEVANYRSFARHNGSMITVNGSMVTAPIEEPTSPTSATEDQLSVTSSFICRNIAILQMGSQSFLPNSDEASVSQVHERSSLLETAKTAEVPRTVHREDASLHSVSLGGSAELTKGGGHQHDCLKSPCSPAGNDDTYHLYDRFNPEIPYFGKSNGYSKAQATDQAVIHGKARKWLLAFLCSSLLFGLILIKGGRDASSVGEALCVAAALLVSLIPILLSGYFLSKLQTHQQVSPRKHRVPAFPYLSLLCCFLLVLLLCTSQFSTYGKIALCAVVGKYLSRILFGYLLIKIEHSEEMCMWLLHTRIVLAHGVILCLDNRRAEKSF